SGASLCTIDADCMGFVCRDGACVGPPSIADAGPDAPLSADGSAASTPVEPGGGCDCTSVQAARSRNEELGTLGILAIAMMSVIIARRSALGRACRAPQTKRR